MLAAIYHTEAGYAVGHGCLNKSSWVSDLEISPVECWFDAIPKALLIYRIILLIKEKINLKYTVL
jgi:hypothetical protein